jgi:hypothetical protein
VRIDGGRDELVLVRPARVRPGGDVSDFAANRLDIIAQGFSPGLSVARIRPDSGDRVVSLRLFACYSYSVPNIGATFRAPFTDHLTQGAGRFCMAASRQGPTRPGGTTNGRAGARPYRYAPT